MFRARGRGRWSKRQRKYRKRGYIEKIGSKGERYIGEELSGIRIRVKTWQF